MRLAAEKRTVRFLRNLGEKLSGGALDEAPKMPSPARPESSEDSFLPGGSLPAWFKRGDVHAFAHDNRRDADG